MSLQKTEKTMAELQIDLNMAFEFDKITEQGSSLQPIYGPGYAGTGAAWCLWTTMIEVGPKACFTLKDNTFLCLTV